MGLELQPRPGLECVDDLEGPPIDVQTDEDAYLVGRYQVEMPELRRKLITASAVVQPPVRPAAMSARLKRAP